MIQAQKTSLPSSVIRRDAYQRLADPRRDGDFFMWIAAQRLQFERRYPQYIKRSDDSRRAFDKYLEELK